MAVSELDARTVLFEFLSLSVAMPALVPALPLQRRLEQHVQIFALLVMPIAFDVLFAVGLANLSAPIIPVVVGLGLHGVLLMDRYTKFSLPRWAETLSPIASISIALAGGLVGVMSLQGSTAVVHYLCGSASMLMVSACACYWLGELRTRVILSLAGCSLAMLGWAAILLHKPIIALGLVLLAVGVVWRACTVSATECRLEDVLA